MSSTDKIPAENPSGIEIPELREEDKFAARMLREAHVYDAEDIHRKIDAYCMDTMQSNAQHGALPFFLITLPFAALFTTFGSPLPLFLWLAAVTIISGLRLFFVPKYWRSEHRADAQWMRINITLLAILGCLFGLTPFVFPAADKTWLFAVSNLWFAGVVVSVMLSQGIVAIAGLAFALPAIVPLFCLLLFSDNSTHTLMGLGNVLLFTYLYSVIRRSRSATLEEARRRVMFEQLARYYDHQCRRSESLVGDLTKEIERRKVAEVALR